ncbi:DNA methyltransferase [Heyndrickxia faecalis]|uniref:DNA methyltransferase n=1 Tax=Heyndrickxia faecalis TaxID=2824910 RepID=UPI0032B2DEEC
MTDESKQLSLNIEQPQTDNGPVVCLGMTFKNDDERREYFRNELRKKLPELKKIEGFPIGDDEDIIALSDPPYYTPCPNPWINNLIDEWSNVDSQNDEYNKTPFVSDVSEGKNDAFYNAHGYHTKVPYKAILRYILHYTSPGDVVFDGFSGTGMTGVAATAAADEETLQQMGYDIDNEGNIFVNGTKISTIGKRKVVLNDLSPAASVITYNYSYNINKDAIIKEANNIIEQLNEEYSWMYQTIHTVNGEKQKDGGNNYIFGTINNVVWSDVFACPNCTSEILYWDLSVDFDEKKIKKKFTCPNCKIKLTKNSLEKIFETKYDPFIKKTIDVAKQVPVLISYSVNKTNYYKKPDEYDYETLNKIDEFNITPWFPTFKLPEGYNTKQPIVSHGLTHVHHFYTKRNLIVMAKCFELIRKSKFYNQLIFFFQASINRATKTNRFRFGGTGGLSGTLYVPSLNVERTSISLLESKLKDFVKILKDDYDEFTSIITTQSSTNLDNIPSNSIDYIFTDPPFGSNIMYSELNFLWESWFKIKTNTRNESIINSVQNKGLPEYQELMTQSFKHFYRILKPGRWITVEFSNSQASIWNAIQDSLQKAGFIIANVSALDKKQGSFKAVTTTTAVKQDLVISAYKPKEDTIEKMKQMRNTEESMWEFVTQHLQQLPVFDGQKGEAKIISERTPRILFDRMVAYFVQNGLHVPMSSGEFQASVAQKYPMRDGMVFLDSQVAEYDKKRTLIKEFVQQSLFVSDENSAIEWIRQQLMKKPQTRQDLHPEFMKQIQHIAKHEELPELDDLLEQNFLRYDGDGPVPNQILTYLRRNYKDLRGLEPTDPKVIEKAMHRWYVPDPNKQADLEKLREKSLLREFDDYLKELEGNKKKLRTFRTEAIRAGFKNAYKEKDFETIVKVGDRIPEKVIQEDDKLFMYYENAKIRLGL